MKNVGVAIAGLALLAALAGAAAPADDRFWTQWRGPLMTGVAPGGNPPVEWAEDKNVSWKIEIPGRGKSTPVVWNDRVIVTTAIPADTSAGAGAEPVHEFHVMALGRENGTTLWNQTARIERPHEGTRPEGTFANGSVVTDGEHIVAFFGSRGLFCYDMDGNLRWDKDFGDMDIRNDFGEGATPALHGDTVVVTWDHQGPSFIVALDKNTGKEIWRKDRDEVDTWATPLVVEHNGVSQVITAGTNRVRSYNLTNGELLWEGAGLTMNPIPSPVFADGVVYLMSGYRGNALRAIRLADAKGDITGTSAVLWEHNRDTPYVSSPLLYENNLYFLKSNSAILTTLDARTGQPLYGPLRLEGLSEVYASPVGAAGRVYLLGRDGNALVIENSPEFKILARNALDDGFDASPAIVGEEMYLRGYRSLYKIAAN
ncbi:MAG: PQQ-binding-like beta-propeller repeat protein [Vicinamibacteria bacterium]